MLTNTGIAYLKSKVKDFEPTWAMFDRADLKGRMTMLNDMRETIGAALKFLGYSLNTTDEEELAEARDVVIRWKKNLAKFENEQYKIGHRLGRVPARPRLQRRHPPGAGRERRRRLRHAPRGRLASPATTWSIPKAAKAVALAHAFINFLHDPAVAAENTDFIPYLCPNRTPTRCCPRPSRTTRPSSWPAEIQAKSEVIDDLGADNAKYVKVWDEIKAAK